MKYYKTLPLIKIRKTLYLNSHDDLLQIDVNPLVVFAFEFGYTAPRIDIYRIRIGKVLSILFRVLPLLTV